MRAQLESADRLKAQSSDTADRLRLTQTRLDELAARATEVSVGASDSGHVRHRRRRPGDRVRELCARRSRKPTRLEPAPLQRHRRHRHCPVPDHRAAPGRGVRHRHRPDRARRRLQDRQRDTEHRVRAAARRRALGDARPAVHLVPRARRRRVDERRRHGRLGGAGRAHRDRGRRRAADLRAVQRRRRRRRRRRRVPRRGHDAHPDLPAADPLLRDHGDRQRVAQLPPPVLRRGVDAGARQPGHDRRPALAARSRTAASGSSPTCSTTAGCGTRSGSARRSASPSMAVVLVVAVRRAGVRYRPLFDLRHPAVQQARRAVGMDARLRHRQPGVDRRRAQPRRSRIRRRLRLLRRLHVLRPPPRTARPCRSPRRSCRRWRDRSPAATGASFVSQTSLGIRLVTLLTLPAGVLMFVLRRPIIGALLQHGEYTAADGARTRPAPSPASPSVSSGSPCTCSCCAGSTPTRTRGRRSSSTSSRTRSTSCSPSCSSTSTACSASALAFAIAYVVCSAWALNVLVVQGSGLSRSRRSSAACGGCSSPPRSAARRRGSSPAPVGENSGGGAWMRVIVASRRRARGLRGDAPRAACAGGRRPAPAPAAHASPRSDPQVERRRTGAAYADRHVQTRSQVVEVPHGQAHRALQRDAPIRRCSSSRRSPSRRHSTAGSRSRRPTSSPARSRPRSGSTTR